MADESLEMHALESVRESTDFESPQSLSRVERDTLTPESVCGVDTRTKVVGTTMMPYKAIAKLYLRTQTGQNFIGTGFFTHSNKLFTAAHCVYDHDRGGWMDSITVVPAMTGISTPPYGEFNAIEIAATAGWINGISKRLDMGAIMINGHLEHGDFISPVLTDVNSVRVCGYPGDRDEGLFQYEMTDSASHADGRHFYSIDTFGGQSGAPVLKNSAEAIGIHNYGGCPNKGSDLYESFITEVDDWSRLVEA